MRDSDGVLLGFKRFQVRDAEMSITVGLPPVILKGTVQIAGTPIAGARLTLMSLAEERSIDATTSNDQGMFVVRAASPGDYAVVAVPPNSLGSSSRRDVVLVDGWNAAEFTVSGVALTARLVRHDPRQGVSVILTDSNRTYRRSLTAEEREIGEVRLTVPCGKFRLGAVQANALTAPFVEIAGTNGAAILEDLVFGPTESVLRITDLRGMTQDASVVADGFVINPSMRGYTPLTGIPPGAHMIVRARGFAPACATVPFAGVVDVRLSPGRDAVFILSSTIESFRSGEFGGAPGSTCGLPVRAFEVEQLPDTGDGRAQVLIRNFPPIEQIEWSTPTAKSRIDVAFGLPTRLPKESREDR